MIRKVETWEDFVDWWKATYHRPIPVSDLAVWRLMAEGWTPYLLADAMTPNKIPTPKQIRKKLTTTTTETKVRSVDNAIFQNSRVDPLVAAKGSEEWTKCKTAMSKILADESLFMEWRDYLLSSSLGWFYAKLWTDESGPTSPVFLAQAKAWYCGVKNGKI